MGQRGYSDDDRDTPLEWWVTAYDARRKAYRAFAYGAVICGVIGFGAGVAWSGDTADFGGTGCQLITVTGQAHVAEVRCHNVNTAGPSRDEGTMDAGGLTVGLQVFHGPGDIPDSFIVIAPDGYAAIPPILALDEWTSGTVWLFPFVGS